jgi:uncharacterized protein
VAHPTIVIIPGLRDHVPEHWQTHLAALLPEALTVPPLGRVDLRCAARVEAIERTVQSVSGPIILVAHSGGVIAALHWAKQSRRAVHGALLAAPADFEAPLPDGYPTTDALRDGGWLPVPRMRLPFASIVAASRNDPLCGFHRAADMARDWGARVVDLGAVGHLNPASGFGPWPRAQELIAELA